MSSIVEIISVIRSSNINQAFFLKCRDSHIKKITGSYGHHLGGGGDTRGVIHFLTEQQTTSATYYLKLLKG